MLDSNLNLDAYDYFGEGGGIDDAVIVPTGYRTVTVYGPATHHEGLKIEKGGFGIDVDKAPVDFGEIETIMNAEGKSYKQRTATEISVAVIDVSDTYYTIEDENGRKIKVATFQKGVEKCYSHFSFLVVFDCDPERRVYQLTQSAQRSKEAAAVFQEMRRAIKSLGVALGKNGKPADIKSYGVWFRLGLGDKFQVGKPPKQSFVRPLKIAQATDPKTLLACAVSREDYRLFTQLREETRVLIESGFYKGISQSTELALA